MPWVLKGDPLGVPRNPLAVYLLALALFSGALQLAGLTTTRTIEDSLPYVARTAWAFLLVMGSGASLGGMYWPGAASTGLLLKRSGMFTLSVAATIYAIVLVVAVGLPASLSAGIILGFAVACWVQYRVINRRVHQVLTMTRGTTHLDRMSDQ